MILGENRTPKIRFSIDLIRLIQQIRELDIKKVPSISETIDWARTLLLLHTEHLDSDTVRNTLNVILKFEEDIEAVNEQASNFIKKARPYTE